MLGEALRSQKESRELHQNPLRGAIDEWSDEDILAALHETLSSAHPEQRHGRIAQALLSEVARRNPQRAMEWVQKLPAVDRTKYTGSLIDGWVPERLDEAFVIVKKNPDLFGKTLPWNLVTAALADAFKKSPEGYVTRLAELSREDINSSNLYEVTGVPQDFDYAAVLDSPEFKALNLKETKNALIESWATTDREAAFRWIMEHEEDGVARLLDLENTSHQVSLAESLGFAKWICGKLEEFSPEQKAKFVETHLHRIQPDGLMWIEAAQDPELKDAIRSKMAEMIFSSMYKYVEIGFSSLETLPDIESRLAALEAQIRKPPVLRYEGKVQDPVRELMLDYLSKWGVEPQRAEALVKRMHDDIPVYSFGK